MMLPILLLVWLENNFFYVLIVGIGLSLINETINLSKKYKLNIKINIEKLSFFILLILVNIPILFNNISYLLSLLFIIIYSILSFIKYRHNLFSLIFLALILFSTVFSILVYKNNSTIILHLIIINSISDISAYIFGSFFKGPKIFPKISPNKTFSGSLSAVFCSIIISVYLQFSGAVHIDIILGFLISIFGQFGDLLASMFKRKQGFKDSGHFIPGHGGFLDRCDSLLLSTIFIFIPFYFNFI